MAFYSLAFSAGDRILASRVEYAVNYVAFLQVARINVTVSRPSSTLLDAEARHLPPVIRASVHYYNDEDEIARFAAAIAAF
jgi:selenocysteine lyase/cysteine desulfurase